MNKLYLHSLLSVIFFIPLSVFAQDVVRGERPPVDLDKLPPDAYVKGRLSIKFKPAAVSFLKAIPEKNNNGLVVFGNAAVDELNRKFAVKEAKRVFETILQDKQYEARHKAWGFHLWYELEIPGDVNVVDAIKQYTALGIIETAEPEYKKILYDNNKKLAWTPADPQYANQWNYNNTGQQGGTVDADIDLPEAWDIQKGNPNVIVAVVDGGVDTTHPDLRANLWIGAGNRFGYNFVTNSNLISPYDHGCHTAGTIAAVNNNSIGVSGIAGGNGTAASGVRIMSCQVFNNSATASVSGFANAYIFSADKGAAISQNSWGYNAAPGYYEQSILDAIDYFIQNGGGTVLGGGIVIFSAGNSGVYEQDYPGAYHRVISVAATNNMDQRSDYSTYGQWVDISAPGGEINSVSARGVLSTVSVANGSYAYYQGTSMAAPHVSGVAALIISQAPGRLSNDDVKSILLTTTDNLYGVNPSFTNMLGTGRLNAFNALTKTNQVLATPAVDTPINFSASSSGCNAINLAWTKNAANNDVMIAVATDKNDLFGIPSGGYSAGNTIAGGGTVIYKGSGTAFNWTTALLDSVHYYFKIWSVTAANAYSAGKVKFIVKNGTQSPVANFIAVAGDCQASLSWTKSDGCPASEVIVAANTTNVFGIPSGNLVAGNSIAGGGTILYRGSALSYNHTGLGDSTSNFYAVWAASSSVYSIIPQIINGGSKSFIPSFTATAISSSQINLGWTKNSCFSGNVLVAYSTGNIFGNPSGIYIAGNPIIGGGVVLYIGPLSNFNHTGLVQAAMYHYRIWPIISAGVYGLSKTRSLTTMCGSGVLNLPVTDNFNYTGYNACQWDTVFVSQAGGSIRPELSLVTTGMGPVATPAEGNYMIKFNSFECYTGAQMRLVSKPIATNGNSMDVIYRWYHDNSNYTSSFYDGEGIKLQWSADGNTWNTFDTADRKPPAACNASGWKYKQATLPPAALTNPQIRIGFLFTSRYGDNCYLDSVSIFNTKLKLTDGITKAAVSEYTDAAGWTHYNDSEGERLLSIKKNGNNIGYVNQAGFGLVVGGANGFSVIANTGTNYATNPGGWRTMNRYYDLDPVTEPSANCNVRFYYTTADSMNLRSAALTLTPPVSNVNNNMFTVYKINEIAAAYNLDPAAGHTNIPKATAYNLNGFWQYGLAASPSTSNWVFGNMGSNMRYAEYIVKHFGGGGIGIGGAGQGALPVKWLSFTGKLVNNMAALQWMVSEETNVQDYEVEVSKNNEPFISAATVSPLPARSMNTYLYNYPFTETGTYYFRIKQKDLDGRYSYSIVIKIFYSKNGLIVLSPNPAKEYMEIKGAGDLTGIQLTDVLGKTVRIFTPAANNIYSLQGVSKGVYFVRIITGSLIHTQKLMIE
jgi:subtilisin family serine protease